MLVVRRPPYTRTELSASLRMSFTFLIFGLFVVDVIQTVFASPEPKKLTNEEVLKELGVEIKMKGKNDIFSIFHVFQYFILYHTRYKQEININSICIQNGFRYLSSHLVV